MPKLYRIINHTINYRRGLRINDISYFPQIALKSRRPFNFSGNIERRVYRCTSMCIFVKATKNTGDAPMTSFVSEQIQRPDAFFHNLSEMNARGWSFSTSCLNIHRVPRARDRQCF